ncbi:hypothetical protein D3C85_1738480 [compost metagenome]
MQVLKDDTSPLHVDNTCIMPHSIFDYVTRRDKEVLATKFGNESRPESIGPRLVLGIISVERDDNFPPAPYDLINEFDRTFL